jgi:glycosyltransferase involved in cell wall biosynthesis
LFVAPSRDEPFGQVYLEAMATGLAVIGTTSGGPLDFVNTDPTAPEGWLVDPDDETALADALVAAIDDDGERQTRGERGLATVRRSYSWATIASRWIGLYGLVAQTATGG